MKKLLLWSISFAALCSAGVFGIRHSSIGVPIKMAIPSHSTRFSWLDSTGNWKTEATDQSAVPLRIAQTFTVSNWCFNLTSAQPVTGTLEVSLRKNRIATTATMSIAPARSGLYKDVTRGVAGLFCARSSVQFKDGDLLSIAIQNNAATTSAFVDNLTIEVEIPDGK